MGRDVSSFPLQLCHHAFAEYLRCLLKASLLTSFCLSLNLRSLPFAPFLRSRRVSSSLSLPSASPLQNSPCHLPHLSRYNMTSFALWTQSLFAFLSLLRREGGARVCFNEQRRDGYSFVSSHPLSFLRKATRFFFGVHQIVSGQFLPSQPLHV